MQYAGVAASLCFYADQAEALAVLAVLALGTLGQLLGNPGLLGVLLFPALMLLAAMFFTSLYFSYRDSFELEPPAPAQDAA